ncbi:MAG: flippase-like domain-containing protein [Thermococcus sp.]|nr:flippase-like domain-containing protein [Thermococcus sp.]
MDWKKVLPFVAAVLVIIALVWWAGTEDVVRILKRANVYYLFAALLMYFAGIITWAMRWQVIIEGLGVKVRFRDTLAALFIGLLFNNITPGARGGGEAVRVYYLVKRSKGSYGQLFASVTADRILDLIPIMTMLIFSSIYVYSLGFKELFFLILLLTLMLAGLTGLATVVMVSERRVKKVLYAIFNFLARLVPTRVKKHEEKFHSLVDTNIPHFTVGLRIAVKNRKTFVLSVFYSFVTWAFVVLRNYFIFLSLGCKIGLLAVVTVQMIATTVGIISVIPGGAGIIEAVTSGTYVVLGVTKEMAVTSSILDRIISFWLPLLLGTVMMAHFGLKPKEKA